MIFLIPILLSLAYVLHIYFCAGSTNHESNDS